MSTKQKKIFSQLLVPNDGKELISSDNVIGGLHVFTKESDLNTFLSYSYINVQQIGMLIHTTYETPDKFYQLTALAYEDEDWNTFPATIEEVKFGGGDTTSAYTYSSYTISTSGEIKAESAVTYSGSSVEVIEHLLGRVSYLEQVIENVNRKSTLYDAYSGDSATITFDAPYTKSSDNRNMSGQTGVHVKNAFIDIGVIDTEDDTTNSGDMGMFE